MAEETNARLPDSDKRIIELRDKHREMESKINELRELSKKRDNELQSIKETIRDCKDKVSNLRSSFGEDGSGTMGFGDMGNILSDSGWRDPGNLKMAGGAILLLYVLTSNPCFFLVPKTPRLYNLFYLLISFYHFVLLTGIPLVRLIAVHMGLEDGTIRRLESILTPWYHVIGASMCGVAILLLKLKRCSPTGGCGAFLQMSATSLIFLVELAAFAYLEGPEDSGKFPHFMEGYGSTRTQAKYVVTALQALNIMVSISLK